MIPEPVARCRVRHDGLLCFQWADVLNGTYLYTGIYTGVERSSLNAGLHRIPPPNGVKLR